VLIPLFHSFYAVAIGSFLGVSIPDDVFATGALRHQCNPVLGNAVKRMKSHGSPMPFNHFCDGRLLIFTWAVIRDVAMTERCRNRIPAIRREAI
jgi:hypothetical protein